MVSSCSSPFFLSNIHIYVLSNYYIYKYTIYSIPNHICNVFYVYLFLICRLYQVEITTTKSWIQFTRLL